MWKGTLKVYFKLFDSASGSQAGLPGPVLGSDFGPFALAFRQPAKNRPRQPGPGDR